MALDLSCMSLGDPPPELAQALLRWLDPESSACCMSVNRFWCDAASSAALWESRCHERWPDGFGELTRSYFKLGDFHAHTSRCPDSVHRLAALFCRSSSHCAKMAHGKRNAVADW